MKRSVFTLIFIAAVVQAMAAPFVGGRQDFRDETIYFAMTTRFYDGDPSNNTYCWDGRLNDGDPEWRGDFKGLIAKLDYIKALGFTAVWISPVVDNASGLDYHGYHAIDFTRVDHRYESDDCSLQQLIDAVHARGMKLVLDVVLQHTGNFGEATLCPMFSKDLSVNPSDMAAYMQRHPQSALPAGYDDMTASQQHAARLALMKNTDGQNHDTHNYWHHVGNNWGWDDASRWWGQIAGDCVDLNTENPAVYNYLISCYSTFIDMGVDALRIDTGGHIARLTFNKAFIPGLEAAASRAQTARGGSPFFMFAEVCARSEEVIYRGENYNCSPCFYTWAEDRDYPWDDDPTSWNSQVVPEGSTGTHTNALSVLAQGSDYAGHASSILRHSDNALLRGNAYHQPDYSAASGLSVIDFAMHWRFSSAQNAFGVRHSDDLYNDATWNVVYVDSHDYGPNGQDRFRFDGGPDRWAENLDLMFTWRGIPCIYYGSEIEFRRGVRIDEGPNLALRDSGRAYYGGYIEGNVTTDDFASYTSATGNVAATLSHPLAAHLRRLNQIRAAVPALRRGQYSTDGCSGSMAFKRRYTDSTTDSYVLVTISGPATFTGVESGTYVDCITGHTVDVTDGTLIADCPSRTGAMRVYVLTTALTPAPGRVGDDGRWLYTTAPVDHPQLSYDGNQEPVDITTVRAGSGGINEPEQPIEPSMEPGEQAIFFENVDAWSGTIRAWVWSSSDNYTGGSWPGERCTYLGRGIWKWHYGGSGIIPSGSGVVFNNGSGTQTADFDFVNGGYYTPAGLVRVVPGAGDIPDDPRPQHQWTFYYQGTAYAPAPRAYVWDAGAGNRKYLGSWPGTVMTPEDGGLYRVSFVTADELVQPMIIFNDGHGSQTADWVAVADGIYDDNGFTGLTSMPSTVVTPSITVTIGSRCVMIHAVVPTGVAITTLDGLTRIVDVAPGTTAVDLPSGFYIIDRNKVFVR